MKEDHFVKVRGMIKDMIAKLEADAASEGDQKAWCDTEMEKATSSRDENIGATEGDLAAKSKAEAAIAKLNEKILTHFYDNALIQTSYKPPNSDASGNTVGDLAPDSFSGDFAGNQDAATGIIGQLDVIKSDFEGTID